jgi:hypothetical protein
MLSLPQKEIRHNADRVITLTILDVYENDFPVQTILCLMSGIPVSKWETINAFECVLQLAEKWDTPGPIQSLRTALTAHGFIESHPLRCYRLATHFNWRAEAKLASTHSLTLDIFEPIHRNTLAQLSPKDLLLLLSLHHKRQIMFRELLHCPERFVTGNRRVLAAAFIIDYCTLISFFCSLVRLAIVYAVASQNLVTRRGETSKIGCFWKWRNVRWETPSAREPDVGQKPKHVGRQGARKGIAERSVTTDS